MGRSMLYCGGTRPHVINMLRLMLVMAAWSSPASLLFLLFAMTLAYFWLSGDVGSEERLLLVFGGAPFLVLLVL